MAMISTLAWGSRKTGATITGCTHDRAERQVMDRIVETGGRCCLVADSRIGCSRQKATPTGMSFGNRWVADRCVLVLDFRIDRLSSGRHGERRRQLRKGLACGERSRRLAGVGTGTVAGWRGGWSDETGNGKFRNESCSADPYAAHFDRVADGSFWVTIQVSKKGNYTGTQIA